MRASSGSRAKARTASALPIESATWPATTLEAASRTSTSRCRRRISGRTIASVASQHADEDDHQQRRVQTRARRRRRRAAARWLTGREAQDVKDVFEAPGVAERPLGERAGKVVMEKRQVFRQQLVHRLDVQRLHAANFNPRHEQKSDAPDHLSREPDTRESKDVGSHSRADNCSSRGEGAEEPAPRRAAARRQSAHRRHPAESAREWQGRARADLCRVAAHGQPQGCRETLGISCRVAAHRHGSNRKAGQNEKDHHLVPGDGPSRNPEFETITLPLACVEAFGAGRGENSAGSHGARRC